MSNRRVRNTAAEANTNPAARLGMALIFGASESIELEEARGQRELVESESIPTAMRDITDEQLTAMGFELGPAFEDDQIFRPAKLPPGWSRKASNHAMWSSIVDDKGRERFDIFYKAAFYDRSAHMSIRRRFSVGYRHSDDYKVNWPRAMDGEVVLWEGNFPGCMSEVAPLAEAWLDEHRPGWRDPLALWDLPPPDQAAPPALGARGEG